MKALLIFITLVVSSYAQSIQFSFGVFNPSIDDDESNFYPNMYAKAGYSYTLGHYEVGFLSGMYTNERISFSSKTSNNKAYGTEDKFMYKNISVDLYTKYSLYTNKSSPFLKVGVSKIWDRVRNIINYEGTGFNPTFKGETIKNNFVGFSNSFSIGYDIHLNGSQDYDLPIRLSIEFTKSFGGNSITFIEKNSIEVTDDINPNFPNSSVFTSHLGYKTIRKKLNINTISISLIMPL